MGFSNTFIAFMKVLIIFAHPAYQISQVNKTLLSQIETIPGVTLHDLYERYPEFDIEIKQEQELLSTHDCIVFHYPMLWYSVPSLLKEWMDLVLTHGWAFGHNGSALLGKLFFTVITTGSQAAAFDINGIHQHTVSEFLAPVRQTATICRMTYLPPFIVHGTFGFSSYELEASKQHYHGLINSLIQNTFDVKKALLLDNLNSYHLNES
jgi:glutathione-regulated potassium-efflux system ancillary protein KefG